MWGGGYHTPSYFKEERKVLRRRISPLELTKGIQTVSLLKKKKEKKKTILLQMKKKERKLGGN